MVKIKEVMSSGESETSSDEDDVSFIFSPIIQCFLAAGFGSPSL